MGSVCTRLSWCIASFDESILEYRESIETAARKDTTPISQSAVVIHEEDGNCADRDDFDGLLTCPSYHRNCYCN